MGDFKSLDVWKTAHELTLSIYRATASFPTAERYGLTAQLRGAASSVPAHLAEGCGRHGDTELRRFIKISLGSATELEYHLILAADLALMDKGASNRLVASSRQVQGMLVRLHSSLVRRDGRPKTPDSRRSALS
jgi:four helix bundle protein